MAQSTTTPTTLFVCPTSHLDWDWLNDFEQYYSIGYISGNSNNPVRYTFDQMFDLLGNGTGFRFSLAEMGYFRRYFADAQNAASLTSTAGSLLCLMGGGVTSPDNLLSHGEAFFRNYLLGTQWLGSLGLSGSRDPVAWLPDDFGHDPQLPVALAAMGMQAVGFSRVPGSPQGTPDAKPLDPNILPVDEQLNTQSGLVFPWVSADGSQVLAHFMPDTYSVSSSQLNTFVTDFDASVWGGPNMFVPVPSNDFATPTTQIQQDITNYNLDKVDGVTAQIGTFQDFVTAVLSNTSTLPPAFTLRAENYWTGQFGSRPELKVNHHAAVRGLLGAEATSALLRIHSRIAGSVLDALDGAVEQAWWSLAPSTHHDFITGTSPDITYWREQLPLSKQTRALAEGCQLQAVELLASAVAPKLLAGEVPVMVLNTLGFPRGGLVEIDGVEQPISGVRIGDRIAPVQRVAGGRLIFTVPEVPSLGYTTVYLQPGDYEGSPPGSIGTSLELHNTLLSAKFQLTDGKGWAMTSLVDLTTKAELLVSGSTGNELRLYYDEGNLYQFGNEPIYDQYGVIQYGQFNQTGTLTQVVSATLKEYGPVRSRFAVTLQDPTSGLNYDVEYTLVANEPFLRIRLTGAAPNNQSSVVAAFQFQSGGTLPDGLTHGTALHWDDVEPVRYWWGPTFQATHDYVLPTLSGTAMAAVYHGGTPAWCRDQGDTTGAGAGTILGVLLRSAAGQQRGAAGTDPDTHTQHYAVGVPGSGLDPSTCVPLQNGMSFATPLLARVIDAGQSPVRALPETASLASVSSGQGMIRAARVQAGSGGTATNTSPTNHGSPTSFVLRVYNPTNTTAGLTITLPFTSKAQPVTASLVTALEQPIPTGGLSQPTTTLSGPTGTSLSLQAGQAISTVRVVTQRVFVQGNDGK